MSSRTTELIDLLRRILADPIRRLSKALGTVVLALLGGVSRRRGRLVVAALLGATAYGLWIHPPFASVHQSEVLVRSNVLDGSASAYNRGTVLLLPGVHQLRRYSTRDQAFRPAESTSAAGRAPFSRARAFRSG